MSICGHPTKKMSDPQFSFRILCLKVIYISLFSSSFGLCLPPSLSEAQPGSVIQDPVLNSPSAITPKTSLTLNGDQTFWKPRAMVWYRSEELKERRKQMREMSRPLKRPCYYCHTRNFKDYVEERYLISLQMMAISAEQQVDCEDCHLGKRGLTSMGAFSLIQWRYTTERGMDCSDCHEPHHQFKKLTERGESSRADLIYWIQDQASKLQVPPDVIKNYIQKVSPPKKVTESLNETPKYKDSTVLEDAHTTPLR